jgi:hypothetical protein
MNKKRMRALLPLFEKWLNGDDIDEKAKEVAGEIKIGFVGINDGFEFSAWIDGFTQGQQKMFEILKDCPYTIWKEYGSAEDMFRVCGEYCKKERACLK